MIAFKQTIIAGDRGRDVTAVRRTLHGHLGFRRLPALGDRAGKQFEQAIRSLQHQHHLSTDGVYGKNTHAIVAPHFDPYARWLYEHAKIRKRNPYVNPFAHANVEIGRIDAGVDYHGYGLIGAIGDLVVVGIGGAGWPDGHYLNMRLTSGEHAGRFHYIAEAIEILVRYGQHVTAGEAICRFGPDAAVGLYPGIEMGWGSNLTNLTYADATGEPSGPGRSDTPAGQAFARFLHSVGAPAPVVGAGPQFP